MTTMPPSNDTDIERLFAKQWAYDPESDCLVEVDAQPLPPPDEAELKRLAQSGPAIMARGADGSWHPFAGPKRMLGTTESRARGRAKGHETKQRNRKAWLAYARSRKRALLKLEPDLTQKDIIDRLTDEDEPWPKTVTKRPGRSSLEKAKELWDK
jgi:hypothetical protein